MELSECCFFIYLFFPANSTLQIKREGKEQRNELRPATCINSKSISDLFKSEREDRVARLPGLSMFIDHSQKQKQNKTKTLKVDVLSYFRMSPSPHKHSSLFISHQAASLFLHSALLSSYKAVSACARFSD